jgi:hypothetical protein
MPAQQQQQLLLYLTVSSAIAIVVCAQHGSAYVCTTLDWYLRDIHALPPSARRVILAHTISLSAITMTREEVTILLNKITFLHNLFIYNKIEYY